MANEKIHQYIDSVAIEDVETNQIWIDTDTGDPETNEWVSKRMELPVLAEILRTNFRVFGYFTSDVKQIIGPIDTAQQIKLNNTQMNAGMTLVSNKIVFEESGFYRIQYALNVRNAGGTHGHLESWMKIDGTDIPFSKRAIDVHSNQTGTSLTNEILLPINLGSELTFWMYGSSIKIEVNFEASSGVFPMMPSVSVTIDKI
jgi:hypothetical protein